jgi:hypothetical protein
MSYSFYGNNALSNGVLYPFIHVDVAGHNCMYYAAFTALHRFVSPSLKGNPAMGLVCQRLSI